MLRGHVPQIAVVRYNDPSKAHQQRNVVARCDGAVDFVVHREGFEPPTTWFVARCSIQLSYRCEGGGIFWMSTAVVKRNVRDQKQHR